MTVFLKLVAEKKIRFGLAQLPQGTGYGAPSNSLIAYFFAVRRLRVDATEINNQQNLGRATSAARSSIPSTPNQVRGRQSSEGLSSVMSTRSLSTQVAHCPQHFHEYPPPPGPHEPMWPGRIESISSIQTLHLSHLPASVKPALSAGFFLPPSQRHLQSPTQATGEPQSALCRSPNKGCSWGLSIRVLSGAGPFR